MADLDKRCVSDSDCYEYMVNASMDSDIAIGIPRSSVFCYADGNDHRCGCNAFWGWAGQYCDEITLQSKSNSLIFIIPFTLSAVFLYFRIQIVLKLIRNKLLHFNPSGVCLLSALLILILVASLSALYIIAFFFPNSLLADYIRFGDSFEEESLIPRYIAVGFVVGVFICLVALSVLEYSYYRSIFFIIAYSATILWFYFYEFSLYSKFSDSFSSGNERREYWAEKRFGSILIGINIFYHVATHACCGSDVAAGRSHADIIREADENSSRSIIRANSNAESNHDSTCEPAGKVTLAKTNAVFVSNSKLMRDTSTEAKNHVRFSASIERPSKASLKNKYLSYGNKNVSQKFVDFLVRAFYASGFVTCFWIIGLVSELMDLEISHTYFPASKTAIPQVVIWRCVLLFSFTAVANISLWFLEEASKNRLKARESTNIKRQSITMGRYSSRNLRISNPRGVEIRDMIYANAVSIPATATLTPINIQDSHQKNDFAEDKKTSG